MPTFNEIQQEIAGMLSIPDEELTPGQREAMDAYMDELAKVEADKVDGFGQFLKLQSALAEACKEEARRLGSKARAAEARLAWLKEHYTIVLRENGLKKISGNAYTISSGKLRASPSQHRRKNFQNCTVAQRRQWSRTSPQSKKPSKAD